jgi:hypothetical protein
LYSINSSAQLVGEQQDRLRDRQPERLARGFKPDIGNPIALAPAQAGLFTLALEGCRRPSKQRRFNILKCVHADDGVEAAVDSAGRIRCSAKPLLRGKYDPLCLPQIKPEHIGDAVHPITPINN